MDEQTEHPAGELTPAQSEAVRRLLAGARHDEGIPAEVATRLEGILSELSAERAASAPRQAEVVPLRRRRWPQALAAAAAVTAFGFGLAQLVGDSGGDADSGGSATTADRAPTPEDLTSGQEQAPNAPVPGTTAEDNRLNGAGGLRVLSQQSLSRIGVQGLRQLSPGTLDRDLDALTDSTAGTEDGFTYSEARGAKLSCGPIYTVIGGETFAAAYRRHLALVLFHPVLDGVRLVEIYDCESRTPRRAVRTVTLQAGE